MRARTERRQAFRSYWRLIHRRANAGQGCAPLLVHLQKTSTNPVYTLAIAAVGSEIMLWEIYHDVGAPYGPSVEGFLRWREEEAGQRGYAA